MTQRTKGLLARAEDWHCVVYHLIVVTAYVAAFAVWLNPELAGLESLTHKVVFVLAAAPLLGWISGIDVGVNYHNHTHLSIFNNAFVSRWFERLWTPFCAWPAKYWAHYHVVVHHGRLMSQGDWPDWTIRLRKPNGDYEGCLRYQMLLWPWRSLKNFPREIRGGRFQKRTAAVEMFWFLVVYSIPFIIDPVMGLCLWLLPHWCGNSITMGRGMYIQHAGCEPWLENKAHPHSVNFPMAFFNYTMFNIGYHTEHHDSPRLHWAELPKQSQKMQAASEPANVTATQPTPADCDTRHAAVESSPSSV